MDYQIIVSQSDDEELCDTPTDNVAFKPPLILTESFYSILEKKNGSIIAKCVECNTKISGSIGVTSNYISHIKLKHDNKYQEFLLQKAQNKHLYNRQATKQNQFDTRVLKYLVSSCAPTTTVENPDFIALFEGTNNKVRSRKYMQNLLDQKHFNMVENIKAEIIKTKYICATADIWSGNGKSFFGYTIHWIESNFERKSAALACTRFKSPHNFENIARMMMSISNMYGIDQDKLVCTVTDNASNFAKAFKEFGIENHCEEHSSDEEFFESRPSSPLGTYLSKHVRCASHTLNLLATTDFLAKLKQNTDVLQKHKIALKRCSDIWNKCKRPKSHEIIKNVLTSSLKTPVCTRWNSLYNAITHLLNYKIKLQELTTALGVESLSPTDISYLEEYIKLMAPIAEALDFLQSEKNIFYGHLIPALLTLKYKIRKNAVHLKYLKDIAMEMESELEVRFKHIFYLDKSAFDAVVAAVTCPKTKLLKRKKLLDVWQETSPECSTAYIEDICLSEMVDFVTYEANETKTENISCHSFFKLDDSDDEDMVYVFNSREKLRCEINSFNSDDDESLNSLLKYPVLKEVFFKFNTPLPSSAPVERLFSFAGIVNGQRRHRLTDDHFEELVLAKSNSAYFT